MNLYRQYRPQNFDDIVGQEAIVTTLKNGLKEGKLSHAYLFCGCRGTGKTTLARVLAKALNCTQRQDCQPCNTCHSCKEISSGSSLDVIEIDGASNRGIDDIRKINETVAYAPSSSPFKIYIIDEVHMLTKEAFNALLKTLEEPPSHVKFFFATTEPHKVLPTIISRCQRFDLSRIPPQAMTQKLEKIAHNEGITFEKEAMQTLVLLSEGSLRDAESLLEQVMSYASTSISLADVQHILGLVHFASLSSLDTAIHTQNYVFAFSLAYEVFSSGKDLHHFLTSLISHFRNHLHLQYKLPLNHLSTQLLAHYQTTSSHFTDEQCIQILEYLIEWEQKMKQLQLTQAHLEMILLYIIRSSHRITLTSLTKRLLSLEKGPVQAEKKPLAQEVSPEVKIPEPTPIVPQPPKEKLIDPAPLVQETPKAPLTANPSQNTARYDTVLRFAAIELEGVIKK